MRDFREKGAGMRDRHPRYQTLFEWSPYAQGDRFYRIRDMAYLKVGFRIPEKNRKRDSRLLVSKWQVISQVRVV